QVGLTRTAVERFRARHATRMARAASYSAVDEAQRAELIERARQMKAQQPDLTLFQAAVRLARASRRSVETLRKLLEKHAADVFPARPRRLTANQKRVIVRAARRGVDTAHIAERFGRSVSTIRRTVQVHRAAEVRQRPLAYVKLATFDRDDADEVLLGPPL